jgi:LPS sulfotransferase NodH
MTPPEAPAHSSLHGLSSYREHLERTFELGTTPNGVFASKLMWRQLPELQTLASELPEYAGLQTAELLDRLFGGPAYVWVSRRDKVRQAVSMWRALQTRSWRHGGEREDARGRELVYRFAGIDHLVRSFAAEDRSWQQFFATHGIDALAISYEDDLERDRERSVRAVLHRLALGAPAGWRAQEPLRRQSDALSDDWVATYHRDRRQRDPGARSAAVANH